MCSGSIDIHGAPRLTVWTKLAQDAPIGSTVLVTLAAVDFKAGERIVVTSSSQDFRETEELTVVALNADNRSITVSPPLRFNHLAQVFVSPNGTMVDMRCEVGLLSRNVVIQGDDDSNRQQFGSHIIAVGGGTLR